MDEWTIDDEHFFRIHGAIEPCGFFTMAVMSTPTWPTWAYTIGFLEIRHLGTKYAELYESLAPSDREA